MAQSHSQIKNERLPIKVILPRQGAEKKTPTGGGSKLFRPVDQKYRASLSNQVVTIRKSLLPQIKKTGAIPIKVKLISKATAKSHRPQSLFTDETCPIIGAGPLGELYVKASESGLDSLDDLIRNNHAEYVKKELSAVESIEPITPSYRRSGIQPVDILRHCPKRNDRFVTRVRLFNFGVDESQNKLIDDFEKSCKQLKIDFTQNGYSQTSYTYQIACKDVNDLEAMSNIIGVRNITNMPLIRTVRPTAVNPQPLIQLPKRNSNKEDIPVVVVVDSGITDKNPDLNSWIVGKISDVAPQYQNTAHGSFVAGLICWGSQLNPSLKSIDTNSCGVFDLQVIPNDDPAHGDTLGLLETELLVSLESALKQYANKYKVWNLSLSSDRICSLNEFSPLAEELDNLQEKYQVSFVISAGNYQQLPMLDFPRPDSQLEVGRITSPADSVLGITVGAISHLEYKSGLKKNNPSAFSRHGSGPNHIIKPDLVHYGGSCTVDFANRFGIRSITDSGSAEDLGTSFSTPLVSRTLAQIYHQITPVPSPVLARALLTHHARDPRTGSRVPDGEENYFGFGLPTSLPYCLECSAHTSTLVFEDVLRPGYFLEWDDFPYPPSLKKDGRYFGEIWMTVAMCPSRGSRWGSEYCETHIEANFGVYYEKTARKTKAKSTVFKGLVPPEHKNPGILYESYQIESLRKWAPVRTYHGILDEKGNRGDRWRLKLRLLTRHGIEEGRIFQPQPFSLIVTISDPAKNANVYDEMAQIIRNRFKAQNLTLRSSISIPTQQKLNF